MDKTTFLKPSLAALLFDRFESFCHKEGAGGGGGVK